MTMNLKSKFKGTGIGLLICSIALPAAFIITVLTFRFWRWLESATGIESFGHSGPAEWCYWLVYGILVLLATVVWWLIRRAKQQTIR